MAKFAPRPRTAKTPSSDAEFSFSRRRFAMPQVAAIAGYFTTALPGVRNTLPEPLDVPDHLSNMIISPALAFCAAAIFSELHREKGSTETTINSEQRQRFQRRWVPAAMLSAGILNAPFETRWGTQFMAHIDPVLPVSNGDPLDVLYSVAATGAVGLSLWKQKKHSPVTPPKQLRAQQSTRTSLFAGWRAKRSKQQQREAPQR